MKLPIQLFHIIHIIKDIDVENVISISLKLSITLKVYRKGDLTHILVKFNKGTDRRYVAVPMLSILVEVDVQVYK